MTTTTTRNGNDGLRAVTGLRAVVAGVGLLALYVVGYALVLGLLYGVLAAANPWAMQHGLGSP